MKSELVYVAMYIYIYVSMSVSYTFGPGGHPGDKAHVRNGVLTSYMYTAFVLLAHEGSEIYHLVLRTVCRLSDRNVSFKKQLCSPVAAI